MKNNVRIYGSFAGTETSKEERVSGNNTILDGEGKYGVFYNNYTESNPLTNSAKLDNVTIQNGYASDGAGMYNYYASPEITNCTFTNNSASHGGGGGMYNSYSSPVLTNCTFTNNSADDGGGMYNNGYNGTCSPVLTNCTFSGNSAKYYGGGMYNGYSSPELTNCILWGNTASSSGNEIYNDNYSNNKPTIDTCIIKGGYSSYGTYTNIITADPKLMPLGNYGGSVQTCPVGAGSSAIGAGKVVDGLTTDARGMSRSSTPTIGACEFGNVDITASEENLEDNAMFPEESVSFKVVANETGVNYQWQYSADNSEWIDIDGATSSEFTIDSISSEKVGYYRCVMSGEIYNTKYSSVAHIESKPAPSITTQPEEIGIFTNNDGSLSVSATGESLTFQWYFNGEAIEGATNATLSFENIQADKSGEYYCVITNPAGSVKSEVVSVVVKPAPSITTQPKELGVFINTNQSLSVSATGEELTYQWYFNGKAIEGATESTLSFENIQFDKTGSYYCVITNPAGSVQSSTAEVVVHQTARITKDLKNIITIKEIGYARFEIESDSYNPTFKWYVDGQLLEDETENVLFIKAGTKTSVTVKCVISTDDGKSVESKTVRLNALDATHSQAPLSITTQPADSSPTAWGETSKFTISAKSSSSVLNYQWQGSSDGETWENLEGQTGATCSVKMEGYNKNCFVRCEINNGIGAYLYSNSAKVIHSITPTKQPSGEVWLFDGEFYEFELELGDEFSSGINYDEGVTFQWQISNDSGSTWTNITSDDLHGDGFSGDPLNDDELEIVMTADLDGKMYRCLYSTPTTKNLETPAVTVRLAKDIEITKHPEIIISAPLYSLATFTVEATGYQPQYQWYVMDSSGEWVEMEGETSATLTILVDEDSPNYSYQCCVYNRNSEAFSDDCLILMVDDSTPDPYGEWASKSGLTGSNADKTATPHNDGITNLEKFTFGLDASKATSYGANVNFKHTSDATGASLQFPVSVDAEGVVNVKALKSVDLINWTESTATATGETSSDGKFKIYKATAPIGEEGKVFLKLKVEEK